MTITYDALDLIIKGPQSCTGTPWSWLGPLYRDTLDMFELVQVGAHCKGPPGHVETFSLRSIHVWSASEQLELYWNTVLLVYFHVKI